MHQHENPPRGEMLAFEINITVQVSKTMVKPEHF